MPDQRFAVPILSLLLLSAPAATQSCHDLNGVTAAGQALLQQSPRLGQSCIKIEQRGTSLYEQSFGTFGPTDVVPIASATKTLSAAVLMSLVDEGTLSLDDPVGQYLPEWNVGPHASITLRMCFSHTSGLPANAREITETSLTLRQAAFQLASVPLDTAPGTSFAYGNVSMHVAGAVCEVASGQSWLTLFQQRIAQPLGMTSTDYGDASSGQTNPLIAGGGRSNARDFAAFMSMLRARGTFGGMQILSAAAVDTMLDDQTSGTVSARNVHPDNAAYGLGIWIERQDSSGQTLRAVAAGAFGFTGWVDRAHDSSGVLAVRYFWLAVFPYTQQIQDEIDRALLPDGVTCLGVSTPACLPGAWLNGTGPARAGNPDFALLASRVPPLASGVLSIGDPLQNGFAVLDLTAFVDASNGFAVPLTADSDGTARLPAPLTRAVAGQTFALQPYWLTNDACAAASALASHAILVQVGQ